MKQTLLLLLMVFSFEFSYSITADEKQQQERIKKNVYLELTKKNSLTFNAVTNEGSLNRCEFVFQYADTDKYGFQGEPVLLQGSFAMNYFKGKNLSYSLKLMPAIMDFSNKSTGWKILNPTYASVSISSKLLDKYKVQQFPCNQGGMCIAYDDKTYDITKLMANFVSLDETILYSLQKGGEDNRFKFSDIIETNKLLAVNTEFSKCYLNLLGIHESDVKGLK